jgi:hypothetical protein
MFYYHILLEYITNFLVLLMVQNYTVRKWVVSFSAWMQTIPHTDFPIDTLAWWYHKHIFLYKIITNSQISHEEEKVGSVPEN